MREIDVAVGVQLITGLDYLIGLLDWTTGLKIYPQKSHFPAVTTIVSPHLKQCPWQLEHFSLPRASGHLSIVATPRHGCNREVACVTFSVAKHRMVALWLHRR